MKSRDTTIRSSRLTNKPAKILDFLKILLTTLCQLSRETNASFIIEDKRSMFFLILIIVLPFFWEFQILFTRLPYGNSVEKLVECFSCVGNRRFYPLNTVEYLINLRWRRSHCNANGVLGDLLTKYTLMELARGARTSIG